MMRNLTCIECPKGCCLTAEFDQGHLVKLTGNQCAKGETYARQELLDPQRTLTSTVRAQGLSLKYVPVRTDRPIPKDRLTQGMEALRAWRLTRPVRAGETVIPDFLGLGVKVIATRTVGV